MEKKPKKHKPMPTDYTVMTTDELLDLLISTPKGQTFVAIMTELRHAEREVENDYPDVDLRGGIRPTRRP